VTIFYDLTRGGEYVETEMLVGPTCPVRNRPLRNQNAQGAGAGRHRPGNSVGQDRTLVTGKSVAPHNHVYKETDMGEQIIVIDGVSYLIPDDKIPELEKWLRKNCVGASSEGRMTHMGAGENRT